MDQTKFLDSAPPVLSNQQTLSFINDYLEGIMSQGLIEPLLSIAREAKDIELVRAAESLIRLQVFLGKTPQEAFNAMSPQLPRPITKLIQLGFEKSMLDVALGRAQEILMKSENSETIESECGDLIEQLNKINNFNICSGCASEEITKILKRAAAEAADRVYLSQEGNRYFHQHYLSVKVVHIAEPAVQEVYLTIKKALEDSICTGKGIQLESGEVQVTSAGESTYLLSVGTQSVEVSFRDEVCARVIED